MEITLLFVVRESNHAKYFKSADLDAAEKINQQNHSILENKNRGIN